MRKVTHLSGNGCKSTSSQLISRLQITSLTGIGKKGFIADLMPKLPIYVNLLSKEAQAVIGEVHDNTRPALKSVSYTHLTLPTTR